MRWSPDGSQLASGSNDNLLNIWDLQTPSAPRYTLNQHNAAVKALAWCPWQQNLLASGGGTADRTIRFWNSKTGACLNSVDTKSQVCALQWSKHTKELVSSHGFSQNQLIVWSYPTVATTLPSSISAFLTFISDDEVGRTYRTFFSSFAHGHES